MASRRGRRRRHQFLFVREFWLYLSIALFLGVLVYGLWSSPLTSVTTARIIGHRSDDVERLKRILLSLETKPALQIHKSVVERRVEANPAVLTSQFSANVFGRCTLAVTYRTPVATVSGDDGLALDAAGFVFPLDRARSTPPFSVNVQDAAVYLTISDGSHVPAAARLAEKLQVLAGKLKGRIEVDAAGRLNLQAPGGAKVVFGDGDRLDAKVRVLTELAASNPAILQQSVIVNLVEPDIPTVERQN